MPLNSIWQRIKFSVNPKNILLALIVFFFLLLTILLTFLIASNEKSMRETFSLINKKGINDSNVQLLNENGLVMNLNGMDFSFCLEVLHE
jgi:hypothetical protein